MNPLSLKIGAALTLVALGGLAGFALGDNRGNTGAALKQTPVQVRTQVIRHTVRIHRRPKPVKHPVAPSVTSPPPVQSTPVVASAPPRPVVAAPVRRQAPVRTRTSGATGGGHEHESEHEGSDD